MSLRKYSLVLGLSVLALSFASQNAAHADAIAAGAEVQMVNVSSSYPSGYKGKIVALVDDAGTGLSTFHFSDSRNSAIDFSVDQLRKGVVLVHALGKDILKISAPDFTNDGGGQMILTFLKGFLGSDRREVRFDYIRHGSITDWLLQTDDTQGRDPFDSISIIVSKTLGLPTGVGDITLGSTVAGDIRKYDPNHLPAGTLMLEGLEALFSN